MRQTQRERSEKERWRDRHTWKVARKGTLLGRYKGNFSPHTERKPRPSCLLHAHSPGSIADVHSHYSHKGREKSYVKLGIFLSRTRFFHKSTLNTHLHFSPCEEAESGLAGSYPGPGREVEDRREIVAPHRRCVSRKDHSEWGVERRRSRDGTASRQTRASGRAPAGWVPGLVHQPSHGAAASPVRASISRSAR